MRNWDVRPMVVGCLLLRLLSTIDELWMNARILTMDGREHLYHEILIPGHYSQHTQWPVSRQLCIVSKTLCCHKRHERDLRSRIINKLSKCLYFTIICSGKTSKLINPSHSVTHLYATAPGSWYGSGRVFFIKFTSNEQFVPKSASCSICST